MLHKNTFSDEALFRFTPQYEASSFHSDMKHSAHAPYDEKMKNESLCLQIFLIYATLFSGKEKSPDILIQPEIPISPSPYRKLSKTCNPQLQTPAGDGMLYVRWLV